MLLPVPARVQHVLSSWVPLLKPVAAGPGDLVCYEHAHLTVNGSAYGPVSLEPHGTPLPLLVAGCQTVPVGMVFLASQAPKSLDGRYLGMTPVASLTAVATPVLTWSE